MNTNYIKRNYKDEIDSLPIEYKYYHSLDSNKDELRIHEKKFKVLPKIKFVRKEKKIIISETIIERCHIDIPYTILKKTIVKDCTHFHNDEIEYEVKYKVYHESISLFIEHKMSKYNNETL